ncbi:hemicentin-1-like [Physella acuta]|uniref:hemicentin-1-like n=1 Tax=Physella acuta TaxID=109671 RepID=UPI0027DD1C3A|nr:hemicentin-1-like [Physella acuta]XP_059146967.1 hemicentin-1-like [Physella acuta]XP_059146968.1 hemicentin-1-like [Physella acuta]
MVSLRLGLIFFCALIISVINISISSRCSPAELGRPYSMTCVYNSPTEIRHMKWFANNNRTIAECFDDKCETYIKPYDATVKRTSGKYTYGLNVYDVTAALVGVSIQCQVYDIHHVYDIPVINVCLNLEVFVRPEDVVCEQPKTTSTDLELVCRTSQVYPTAACLLYSGSSLTFPSTSKFHTPILSSPYSGTVSAECGWITPLNSLGLGRHELVALIYPSITDGELYGTNSTAVTVDLYLPSAALDKSCPTPNQTISVQSVVTCTCSVSRDGNPPGWVQWFYNNQPVETTSSSNGSATVIIYYNIDDPAPLYVCRVESRLGFDNNTVVFKPNYQAEAVVLNFNALIWKADNNISMSCVASGNPAPKISILRSGRGSVVASTSTTRVLNHLVTGGTCLDIDEYVCRAENNGGVSSKNFTLYKTCSPLLQQHDQNNQSFPTTAGNNVLIEVNIFGYPKPSSYSLKFELRGILFEVWPQKYNINYIETTPLYGVVKLALFDIQEEMFTRYVLTISNLVDNDLQFYFTITKPNDNKLGLGLGLGIGLGAAVIMVVVGAVVLWKCRTQRTKSDNTNQAFNNSVTQNTEGQM